MTQTLKYAKDNLLNQVFYKSSIDMSEVPDSNIDLIITSPPYFNIKDYAKDGYQNLKHSESKASL